MEITTIGLYLAKNIFYVVSLNQVGKIQMQKELKRSQMLLAWTSTLRSCTL